MTRQKAPSHAITGVFVFLLLGLFAVFSTVMVLLGVKAYRGSVERTGVHNTARINTAYIRSMLRADDENGVFAIEDAEGVLIGEDGETETPVTVPGTLALRNLYDGEPYITRIYVYEGSLREWFTAEDAVFRPDEGEIVCPADEMQASLDGRLLTVRVRAGDEQAEICYALRSAQ